MEWARIPAYISGTVDQELLLRNEYLTAENQILRGQLRGAAKALGRRASEARRDWSSTGPQGTRRRSDCRSAGYHSGMVPNARRAQFRWLEASKPRPTRVDRAIEELIVLMAEENRSRGYDRIVGALANLGFEVSDQTVGNVLRRHGVPPAPERKCYVPFFIHLESRRVDIAGITIHPDELWMKQIAERDHGGMRRPTGLFLSPA